VLLQEGASPAWKGHLSWQALLAAAFVVALSSFLDGSVSSSSSRDSSPLSLLGTLFNNPPDHDDARLYMA